MPPLVENGISLGGPADWFSQFKKKFCSIDQAPKTAHGQTATKANQTQRSPLANIGDTWRNLWELQRQVYCNY